MKRAYRPQLAKGGGLTDAEKYLRNDDYLLQEKFDGVRMVFHKDKVGRCSMYTRHISKVTGKQERHNSKLYHIISELRQLCPNGTILDGELVLPERYGVKHTASDVMSILNSSNKKAQYKQNYHTGRVKYMYFDALFVDGFNLMASNMSYEYRHAIISKFKCESTWFSQNYTMLAPHIEATTYEEKITAYKEILARGGEGLVLKDKNAPYKEGQRHKGLIKIKDKLSWDVVIMGTTPAKETSIKSGDTEATPTRIAGQVGDIRYGLFKDGELKYLGRVSGFDDAVRSDLNLNSERYVESGRVLEVEGQMMYPSGAIRHATFKGWRDDKQAIECQLMDQEPVAPIALV